MRKCVHPVSWSQTAVLAAGPFRPRADADSFYMQRYGIQLAAQHAQYIVKQLRVLTCLSCQLGPRVVLASHMLPLHMPGQLAKGNEKEIKFCPCGQQG